MTLAAFAMERTSIWTFTTTRNPSTVRAMLWFGYFFKDGDARLDTHLDQYWCMGRIHDCRRMRLQKLMKNCVDILSMHSNHKTKIYYWSLFIEESLAESVIVYEKLTRFRHDTGFLSHKKLLQTVRCEVFY